MMTLTQYARATAILLSLHMTGALAQDNPDADATTNIVEERVTVENGLVEVCGEGDGLDPCLDANGQTYSQEVHGPGIDDEAENTLAAEAARIRAESPEELNKTITEMEQGYNPDNSATMGLPD
jgi:hypothetical protein